MKAIKRTDLIDVRLNKQENELVKERLTVIEDYLEQKDSKGFKRLKKLLKK
ncbi:hypothetical protein ACLM5H_04870 [Fredinandcohnia humi]